MEKKNSEIFADLKIFDKVSSKNSLLKIKDRRRNRISKFTNKSFKMF